MTGDPLTGPGSQATPEAAGASSPSVSIPIAFVVMGSTGEYSDRSEWPVAAYLAEADAQAHAEAADARAREIQTQYEHDRWSIPDGANEYDAAMSMDYTGTSYFVMKVPLYERFAQGIEAGTGETPEVARPEGREPGPKDAPK